jgi:hypothetical protein
MDAGLYAGGKELAQGEEMSGTVPQQAEIEIPAGTILFCVGLPLLLSEAVKVTGTPEELAELHVRLYPPDWPAIKDAA